MQNDAGQYLIILELIVLVVYLFDIDWHYETTEKLKQFVHLT